MPIKSENYCVSQWIFLRAMGAIYLIAFGSLWVQVEGLMGSHGILPVKDFLGAVQRQIGPERYWLVPSLFWVNASDAALHAVCAAGVFFSLFLILGIAPAADLFLLWAFYLSLSVVAQDFLSFQWDALLLEAGLLSIFLAPLRIRPQPSDEPPPSKVILWLLRWLLFRLVFSSGVVKLASHDPMWANLTALTVHYETQPLPTWVGWYAHQLPVWFQKISCGGMFAVELGIPFLIFGNQRLRLIAFTLITAFQLLIMATGNYCFFNLLAIGLCFLLIEDNAWLRLKEAAPFLISRSWPQGLLRRFSGNGNVSKRSWPRWITLPLAGVILLVSSVQVMGLFRRDLRPPAVFTETSNFLAPLRSINSYGLFAVMTTSRQEIVIEGSQDGATWVPYEFRWKPGDLRTPPGFVEPHQPRLDWQLWFAALSGPVDNPWFLNLCVRLLQGSPPVLALLKTNPFPEKPPRAVRAVLYDYRFTDFSIRRATGQWWRREYKGLYCPPLSLKGNR